MLVETGAAPGSASRGVPRLGSFPLLAIPQTNFGDAAQSLWSAADQKSADKRDFLRNDDDRVQNVVAGLGPSMTERIQQVRSDRAGARAGAEKQAFLKGLAQEQATLRSNAAGQSGLQQSGHRPNSAATPDDSVTSQNKAVATASAAIGVDSGQGELQSEAPSTTTTPKKTTDDPKAQLAPNNPRSAQQSSMPAANNPSLNFQLRSGSMPPQPVNLATMPQSTGDLGSSQSQSAASTAAVSSAQSKSLAPPSVESASADRHPPGRTLRRSATTADQSQTGETETDQRAENVQRMLRVLRGSLMRDKSSTIIRLDPPELGSLRLEMNLRKEAMDLRVGAESDAAREMLKEELETLRSGLQAAGIRLERVEVYSLAAPPPVEQNDSRTLERQGGGEPREAAQKRSTARDAVQRQVMAEPEWSPDRLHGFVSQGRVNVVV